MDSLAITDHGNMFGAIDFYLEAQKAGIKPIIGCEVYIAPGSRLDKTSSGIDEASYHLILLARDETGYQNLIKLVSLGNLEGFYYRPRIDKEILSQYQKGLIGLTACLKGEIPVLLQQRRFNDALKTADDYLNILGKDNLYLEIQENLIPEQKIVNEGLIKISKELNLPLIATNDVHYLSKEDAASHEVLLCIQTQATLNDPNRLRFQTDEFYFKAPEEMQEIFKDVPEAITNTLEVASRCNLELDFSKIHLPRYEPPEGKTKEEYLKELSELGLKEKFPQAPPAIKERLEHELKLIKARGFVSYFLIVWDFIHYAKSSHIPVGPGRGCLLPDTKILMNDGGQVDIQNLKVGNYVISHTGRANKVKDLFVYDLDEDIVAIKAKLPALELKLTADHKVLAVRHKMCKVKNIKPTICKPTCRRYCKNKLWQEYKLEWIEAAKLEKNDFLVYSRPKITPKKETQLFDLATMIPKKGNLKYNNENIWYEVGSNKIIQKRINRFIELDEKVARLLGYYVSEGWARTKEREAMIGFGFSKDEENKCREVQELMKTAFDLDSKIVPHKKKNSYQVLGYSKIVAEFLECLCGKYARNKRVPEAVFNSPDKIKREFLTGLFLGDGSNKEKMRIAYDSVSLNLVSQVKMLLSSLGIISSIKIRNYRNSNWNDSYKLRISGRQLFYFNEIFRDFKANIKEQNFYRNDTFIDENYVYFSMQSISTQRYKGKVYDISVERDSTFIANDVVVHNSAAGSLVSYLLGITDINPLKYGLLFERFLNPERLGLPDIDIDFCYERRNEVIDYVTKKYGRGNVAQIITFGTMQARAVVRDVGRVMGLAYADVDRIAKMIPPDPSLTLKDALESESELKSLYKNDPQITKLIDTALSLEGLNRHASTHAAGVVIADKPLDNYTPLFETQDGQITTGYSMSALEKIGLLKVDFLGLRTLTVIDQTQKIIAKTKADIVDIDNIPLDDSRTYKLLTSGHTIGIFQVESSGMRDLLKKLEPDHFEDLIALLALYRPGPIGSGMLDDFMQRRHNRVPIKYQHPKLETILKETYGIIVYQEQIMQIVSELAGFSLAQADLLRRAIAKKIPEVMEQQRKNFILGCIKNNISESVANRIFDLIEYFSGYGFNKCVVGSTEIIDADTGKPVLVKELFANIGSVKSTFSCDNNLKIIKTKIKDVVNNGIKPVYKLKTSLGKEIIATSNHPVFTFSGWKNLGDLCIGERIGLSRAMPYEGCCSMEPYKIIVLAGILSEGNTCHPSGVYYYNNDRLQVEDFVKHVGKFSNTVPRIYKRRGCFEVYVGTGKDTKFSKGDNPWNKGFNKESYSAAVKLITNRKCGLRLWIEQLGLDYKKATEKFIPKEFFCLNKEQLVLFLGRLWSGDGFLFSKNNTVPFYATSSYKLCQQLQDLLLKLGIASRLAKKKFNYRYKNIKKTRVGYALYLYGYESIAKFIQQISPHIIGKSGQLEELRSYYRRIPPHLESKDTLPSSIKELVKEEKEKLGLTWREVEEKTGICMKEFYGRIKPYRKGFRRDTIMQLAHFFESERLLRYVNADITWDSVVSIEYMGKEETFDLEIEDTHNFIANGIVVHNSHSAAYAMISYRTAYLKANFPVEYMCALLTSERDNTDKIVEYVKESNHMGIKVLPPDINESDALFKVVDNRTIRFGLLAVKNVGSGAVESIIQARRQGRFSSLEDLCQHIDLRLVNRKVLESLIKCGALDLFGSPRAQMFVSLDRILELSSKTQKEKAKGQLSFFDTGLSQNGFKSTVNNIPEIKEWPEPQLLAFEKEMLGFYVTGHPLARYAHELKRFTSSSTANLHEYEDGREIKIVGLIVKIKQTVTRAKQEKMAILKLEDLEGVVEILVFPAAFQRAARYIQPNTVVLVKGRLDRREDTPKIIANDLFPMDEAYKLITSVNINLSGIRENLFETLKELLTHYPGRIPIYLRLDTPAKSRVHLVVGDGLFVLPSDKLIRDIESLLGEDRVSLVM